MKHVSASTRATTSEEFLLSLVVFEQEWYRCAHLFLLALGAVAEEKRIAYRVRVEDLHKPFLRFAGMVWTDAKDRQLHQFIDEEAVAILTYMRNPAHSSEETFAPRLMYNTQRNFLLKQQDFKRMLEAARAVFDEIPNRANIVKLPV